MNPPNHHSFISLKETENEYIKTGVIGDGSCFLHAILHAVSSTYRDYDIPQRVAYVANVRERLDITLDQIKKLGGGELYRLVFTECLCQIIKEYGDIPQTMWDNHLIPYISNHWKTTCSEDLTELLSEKFTILVSLRNVWKYTDQLVHQTFQKRIREEWVDEYMIEYFCKIFQRNILILSDKDGEIGLYKIYPEKTPFGKYVVVYWIGECHYEIIGKVENGTCVQRQFTKEDEIVTMFQT